jgi:hypothetical protein
MRWREPWQLFDHAGYSAGIVEPTSTVVAFSDVGLERRRAEPNLTVEELIDFVWQKMSVVHCDSFTL